MQDFPFHCRIDNVWKGDVYMNMTPVRSSNLASVEYDENSRTLYVSFRNGRLYKYSGVSLQIYKGLMSTSSKGQYFDRYIVKAGYSYQRVN